MQDIERQVSREARAMTRREVLTKAITRQLSWVQAAGIWESAPAICNGCGTGRARFDDDMLFARNCPPAVIQRRR
jgi:hypothetical protein